MTIQDEFTNLKITGLQKYRLRHPEKTNEWQKNNPKKHRIYQINYSKNNPEQIKETVKNCIKKHNYIYQKKENSKRRKSLGFNILWKPEVTIEPMEYHHINKEFVVLIPKKINRSIYHNIFTGYNMNKINQLTFDYIRRN